MSKALRIGVVLAGDIVEERLFSRGGKVTVGASPRNDIFLPSSTLPRSISLFSRGRQGWQLQCSAGMDGRLSQDGQVITLEQARLGGEPGRGHVIPVPLSEQDRGKVRLGDVTLLFQFVDPPPAQPKPQLPPSVRGGLITSIDWVLACCFLTIGMLHGGALAYMKTLDFPSKPELEPILVQAIEGFIPIKPPVMMDPDEASKVGEAPVKKKPKPVDEKKGGAGKGRTKKPSPATPCDQACKDARAAHRRASLVKQMARLAESKIFGSKGQGRGIVRDLLKGGDPGQAVAKAYKGMAGVTLASRGKLHGLQGRGESGEGKVIKVGQLGVVGPDTVSTGRMVKERVPTGRVKAIKPVIESGEMGADSTFRIIRRSMRCVKAQYQRGLKTDPELQGKLSLCLKVDLMGRVGRVDVEEDSIGSPTLTTGVSSCMRLLRFPPPTGGEAEVCVPLLLKPASS